MEGRPPCRPREFCKWLNAQVERLPFIGRWAFNRCARDDNRFRAAQRPDWRWAAALCGLVLALAARAIAAPEASIADADFKKLDPFEGRSLARADKAFADKAWRQAAAEYDAFMLEFPRSGATPYALMRKGRSLQWDNKRFEAIKVYDEVLDYFPDAVSYAAPSLYYQGESHWDNGSKDAALKCWQEIADDVDYRKHPLAADAIARLAAYVLSEGKTEDAAKYYTQVTVDFRTSNPEAANNAIGQMLFIRVRAKPDAAKLLEFCKVAKGFENSSPRDDLAENNGYFWEKVRQSVRQYASWFAENEQAPRMDYFRYWADQMEGKHPTWDDFQKDLADFRLAADRDGAAWTARLDKQFAAYQKPDDFGRVVKFLLFFRDSPEKVNEYYTKLNFEKMDNGSIVSLLLNLYDAPKARATAKNVYTKLKFDQMSDDDKQNLERNFWQRDGEIVLDLCNRMKDPDRGRMEQLRFWHWQRNAEKGIPVANACVNTPSCAKEAYWMKAELLHWSSQFEQAIQAYKLADNPAANLFRIAECYNSMGKVDQTLAQLREIENFFVNDAPEAALRIAYVYRGAQRKDQYVASLRGVLKKYPKSGQSSTAHQELEAMGIKIGGGVDAE